MLVRRVTVAGIALIAVGVAGAGLWAGAQRPAASALRAAPVVVEPRPVRPVALPTSEPVPEPAPTPDPVPELPFPGATIYPDRMLVAYYGSAGGGALGVLGERSPDASTKRLRKAAAPFGTPERPVQIVYELIVTVVDPVPGKDGDFNHPIAREVVESYIEAAHRHGALVILDLQPGRDTFLEVAQEWEWALKDPWVGLALDPEWRMNKGIPGRVLGSVRVSEINEVAAWLATLTRENNLPQKLFMVHTFKTSMIRGLSKIADHPELAMILHVDGFGTPEAKLGTFATVIADRPAHMRLGFKLFYDEDTRLMGPAEVAAISPQIDFVSYQ